MLRRAEHERALNPVATSARRQRAPPFTSTPAAPFAPIPVPPFALSLSKGECWQLHPGDAGPAHPSTARTGSQSRRHFRPATACTTVCVNTGHTARANTRTTVRPEPVEGRVLALSSGRLRARSFFDRTNGLRSSGEPVGPTAGSFKLRFRISLRGAFGRSARRHARPPPQFTTDGREPERVNSYAPSRRRH